MGSENAHGCVQKAENGFSFDFDFSRAMPQSGNEFLNRIVPVIGDKTWVSFVNVNAMDAHIFNKQAEKV
jgi:hypothetical protein